MTDIAIVIAAVATAQMLRFGVTVAELKVPVFEQAQFALTYAAVSVILVLSWLLGLSVGDTRDSKIFGTGPDEYKRVVNSTLFVFGGFAIVSYSLRAENGRGYMLIALPLGLGLLLVARWIWRKSLHQQRRRGNNTYATLVVGERSKAAHVISELMRDRYAGLEIIGAVTQRGTRDDICPGVPTLGSFQNVIEVVDREQIDRLVMASADEISPERLRQIGWELDRRRISLIVAASLTDIAGPRIHARPVSGLPLIHVEYPRLEGRRRVMKRLFDLLGSSVGLLMWSPVFLVIAAAVKIGSKGPAFFKQERVGLGGKRFRMLKFRSMVADDELPQLINVFNGEMSLVGPRPPLPSEVSSYDQWTHRRLLVMPGITGLWQVSGRSDLSWEDSVRLDLYYVENWSLVGDILIILRTVKAVISSKGAY